MASDPTILVFEKVRIFLLSDSIQMWDFRAWYFSSIVVRISQDCQINSSHFSGTILTKTKNISRSKSVWYHQVGGLGKPEIYWEYLKILYMSKTWNMPYVFVSALRSLNLSRKSLPPQHIGVNPFSAYPVAGKDFVHCVPHPTRFSKAARCILHVLAVISNGCVI